MPPKTRQQRRAHERRPQRRRRTGSRTFVAVMTLVVILALGAIWWARKNPPPLTRGAIAGEHWHASYRIYICGQRMTNYPFDPKVEEIHTHGDGFMHIHPATPAFSGDNASLGTFLRQYQTSIGVLPNGKRMIIFPDGTQYKDGDRCPGSKKRFDLVLTNKGKTVKGDPSTFIPHDDDAVVIAFGPKGKKALPNPYAKLHGLPDAGFGTGRKAPG